MTVLGLPYSCLGLKVLLYVRTSGLNWVHIALSIHVALSNFPGSNHKLEALWKCLFKESHILQPTILVFQYNCISRLKNVGDFHACHLCHQTQICKRIYVSLWKSREGCNPVHTNLAVS